MLQIREAVGFSYHQQTWKRVRLPGFWLLKVPEISKSTCLANLFFDANVNCYLSQVGLLSIINKH